MFGLFRTCFYAEQGGQIFDEGFIVKGDNEVKVTNVQVGTHDINMVDDIDDDFNRLEEGLFCTLVQ